MNDSFRRIWTPEAFHYPAGLLRPMEVFEGWYFKCVDAAGALPFATIPGAFMGAKDRHAFVQFLDGKRGKAWYVRYPLDDFKPDGGKLDVRVGKNHFTKTGITLDLEDPESDPPLRVHGEIAWDEIVPWPVTTLWPGCMGPYAFIPRMECNHGILSLYHELRGELEVNGERVSYDGGRGYLEKDWGLSFPAAYVWCQSNHFDRPRTCITASVAKIPWLGGAFRGFLIGFLLDGELHRFTTYNGGRVRDLSITETHLHLRAENRTHQLELDAEKTEGALLKAPYEHDMLERVAETMTSTVDIRFFEKGRDTPLYEGRGRHACLELQGKLEDILGAG